MDDFDVDSRPKISRTETSREVDRIVMNQQQAELAKQKAAEALSLASLEAAKIVYELMIGSEDEQVRLRAAEMIFSRTLAKVAAKHIEEAGDTIDSADVANLRESIATEIKRIKGS